MFMYRSHRLALACTALLGWVALPALPAPAAAQQPATQAPKLELFFHNPDVRNAQISPSGKHVALITRAGGEHYVVAVLPTSDPISLQPAAH